LFSAAAPLATRLSPFSPGNHRPFIRTSSDSVSVTAMKPPGLNRRFAQLLQVVVALLGLGTLGLMLWEPHLEGRNAHATAFEIYFHDPFLAYVYAGSIPFFVALQRAFRLFGQVGRDGTFSPASLNALRTIKVGALTILGFGAGGVVIILAYGDGEDRPAGLFMGFLVAFAASVIAATAAMGARRLQRALKRADVHLA